MQIGWHRLHIATHAAFPELPLTSALAALSSGAASTKQETSARVLPKPKVLKTRSLPVLGVSGGGKTLREDAFEDVVSEGVEKTHRTIRSQNPQTVNGRFANGCSDTSDYHRVGRDRNSAGLARFILSSATKAVGQRMLSAP